MKLFKRIVLAWKTSLYWNDALDAYLRDEPTQALTLLEKYGAIRPIKSRGMILQGLVYYDLEKFDLAVANLRTAFINIGQDKRQNPDEDKYLATYIAAKLHDICHEHNIEIDFMKCKLRDYNFTKSNVRKSFLWAFPLKAEE